MTTPAELICRYDKFNLSLECTVKVAVNRGDLVSLCPDYIDESGPQKRPYAGVREYIKWRAKELGVKGFVQRTKGQVLRIKFIGSKGQMADCLKLLKEMDKEEMIRASGIPWSPLMLHRGSEPSIGENFEIYDNEHHSATLHKGEHSDPKYNVAGSYSSDHTSAKSGGSYTGNAKRL